MIRNLLQIARHRREFGVYLRRLRHERGLTCEELAAKVGSISRSALATIERGKRQAGAKVGERLADALNLAGEDRQNFLVAALKTTARDSLPNEAKHMDPGVFMPVWRMLAGRHIKPEDIARISNQAKLTRASSPALKSAALQLAKKSEQLAKLIRAAAESEDTPLLLDLEIETRDGKVVLVETLSAGS
jgi:transcriptional regulator with XRE-family HTH domain